LFDHFMMTKGAQFQGVWTKKSNMKSSIQSQITVLFTTLKGPQ
jgi:hypothetical protein